MGVYCHDSVTLDAGKRKWLPNVSKSEISPRIAHSSASSRPRSDVCTRTAAAAQDGRHAVCLEARLMAMEAILRHRRRRYGNLDGPWPGLFKTVVGGLRPDTLAPTPAMLAR